MVVSKESACLDDAVCEGLSVNHMEMNKFSGEDDYVLVRKQLGIICDQANSIVADRFEGINLIICTQLSAPHLIHMFVYQHSLTPPHNVVRQACLFHKP